MRVWVTGFGPFPGAPVNPTEALVNDLSGLGAADIGANALRAEVLPTEFLSAPARVAEVHARFRPHLTVHFGLAMGARALRLETRAVNAVASDRPDNAGDLPDREILDADGPAQRAQPWPTEAFRVVRASGLPVEASADAGRYVCNAVYYRSLACAATRPGAEAYFVHVPPSEIRQAPDGRERAPVSQPALRTAAVALINVLADAHRG